MIIQFQQFTIISEGNVYTRKYRLINSKQTCYLNCYCYNKHVYQRLNEKEKGNTMYPVHGPRGFISLRDIWPHNIQTVTISLVNKNSDTLHLLETWVANIKNISGFGRAKKQKKTAIHMTLRATCLQRGWSFTLRWKYSWEVIEMLSKQRHFYNSFTDIYNI